MSTMIIPTASVARAAPKLEPACCSATWTPTDRCGDGQTTRGVGRPYNRQPARNDNAWRVVHGSNARCGGRGACRWAVGVMQELLDCRRTARFVVRGTMPKSRFQLNDRLLGSEARARPWGATESGPAFGGRRGRQTGTLLSPVLEEKHRTLLSEPCGSVGQSII